jgi:BMFP domain-containing protein YqiC
LPCVPVDDAQSALEAAPGVFHNSISPATEARLKEQFERVLSRMDLVTREEFEVVQAMAQAAREAQEELGVRVAALEAAQGEAVKPARKASARKPRGRAAAGDTKR